MAAVTTLYAVLIASKAPDRTHPYGYAKFESLASLAEVLLLFSVAGYVFYEGLLRIFLVRAVVEITPFSIAIMLISIGVDFGRSRSLSNASKKYGSQALEADGLHFKADMFTSAIILGGLFVVFVTGLSNADAYAGMIASCLMVYTSLGLGRRTLNVLLDRAPLEVYEIIENVLANLEGIQKLRDIRVRKVGAQSFVDMHIEVPRTYTHEKAHRLATNVEARVKQALPGSDVLVHVDAIESINETVVDKVRLIAAETEGIANVHSVFLSKSPRQQGVSKREGEGNLHLYLDIQVSGDPSLRRAQEIVEGFEKRLKEEISEIGQVTSHLETEPADAGILGTEQKVDRATKDRISNIALSVPGVVECSEVSVIQMGGEMHIALTINIKHANNRTSDVNTRERYLAEISLNEAHRIMSEVERGIQQETGSSRVVVHVRS